jgi:integrase
MVKRPNGSSTLEQLPNGKWRVRATVRGRRVTLGIYDTKKAAQRAADSFAAGLARGAIDGDVTRTLAAWGEDWLDDREVHGSRDRAVVRSIRVERSAWATQVAPSELGRKRVTEITAADVEAWTRWLRGRPAVQATTFGIGANREVKLRDTGRPLSRSSQVHALRLVRHALQAAVAARHLEANPAEGVKIATGGRRARDLSESWLRHSEIGTLLVCDGLSLRLRAAYAAAIGLALRLGDLKAVELGQVDLETQVPGPGVRVWVEKSEKWHRVPVLPWLVPILRAHIASLPAGSRYLFPAKDGERYTKSYDFQWATKPGKVRRGALERAGVDRKIRFHDLRGTTATHLALGTWGRRWSLHEIQQMLAHSDQRVTERYVRRAIDMLAEAARQTTGGVVHALSTTIADPPTPPGGIEPPTVRLEGGRGSEELRTLEGDHGQRVDDAARSVVHAATQGGLSRDLVDTLVELVLARPEAQLAARLREEVGGPLELRLALRLAELVLGRRVHAASAEERQA